MDGESIYHKAQPALVEIIGRPMAESEDEFLADLCTFIADDTATEYTRHQPVVNVDGVVYDRKAVVDLIALQASTDGELAIAKRRIRELAAESIEATTTLDEFKTQVRDLVMEKQREGKFCLDGANRALQRLGLDPIRVEVRGKVTLELVLEHNGQGIGWSTVAENIQDLVAGLNPDQVEGDCTEVVRVMVDGYDGD